MKIDPTHGGKLSATLKMQGCDLIAIGSLIHEYGFYGREWDGGEFDLQTAEQAARDVLAAIEAYREATKPASDDQERAA